MANALVLFGFAWMVAAAFIGLFLARRHELTLAQLDALAGQGKLHEYHRVSEGYKWNKTVHAHAFLFAVVAVLTGLALPRLAYSAGIVDALALAMMAAVPLWTLGGLRSNRPLMVVGDLTLLVCLVAMAAGLAPTL